MIKRHISKSKSVKMCSLERKTQYSKYLSAVNKHDIEELLTHFDDNCEMIVNNATVAKGIDQIRTRLTGRLSNPNYSYEIQEYLPVDNDDRIRVHLKRYDNQHLDVTYIYSKENPQKFIQLIV